MENHPTFLILKIRRALLLASVLYICLISTEVWAEGSYRDTHTIVNQSDKKLVVTFFRGYPVNKVDSRELQKGERLRIDDMVLRPSDVYLITAHDMQSKGKLVYKRNVDIDGLIKLYELDPDKIGIPIRNEDLNSNT